VYTNFHKVVQRHYSGEVENVFTFLYDNFTQDNVYQILSESVRFCRRYDKNILVCFFGSQYIIQCAQMSAGLA